MTNFDWEKQKKKKNWKRLKCNENKFSIFGSIGHDKIITISEQGNQPTTEKSWKEKSRWIIGDEINVEHFFAQLEMNGEQEKEKKVVQIKSNFEKERETVRQKSRNAKVNF